MKIIEFIKANDNWKELLKKDPYNLMIKEENGFTLLKYNQFSSDFNLQIVQEARGIILDRDLNIVAHPFQKFFNYSEDNAAKIDFKTAKVQEKIDGSLIKLWYYKYQWYLSTNGSINAYTTPTSFYNTPKTFGHLFTIATEKHNIKYSKLDKKYTYIFELVSLYNKVVIPYLETKIYHIGTRHNKTGQEINTDIGIAKPKEYKFDSLYDVFKTAKKLPYNKEGYVVVDGNWNRVKVKSPAYVAVHYLKSTYSEDKLLTLIRNGESEEFLNYFPEYKKDHDILKKDYELLIKKLKDEFFSMQRNSFTDKKDFALNFAKHTTIPDIFFRLYDKKINNILEGLEKVSNENIFKQITKLKGE